MGNQKKQKTHKTNETEPLSQVVWVDDPAVVEAKPAAGTSADLTRADLIIDRIAEDALIESMAAASAAFESFRGYIQERDERKSPIEWLELAADLVEAAAGALLEHLEILNTVCKEVIAVAFKHAVLGAGNALEHEKRTMTRIAQGLIGALARQREQADHLLIERRERMRAEWRNVYLSAEGGPRAKEAAVERAMAAGGIALPARDAGRRVYQSLVERFNIDRWIEACRAGHGRLSECATDAAIPGLKNEAEIEAQETFGGTDEPKKKAQPRPRD